MTNVSNILLSGYQKQTTSLVTDTALFLTSLMEKNALSNQRIRLRRPRTSVAVIQQGTLERAAEALNLSQPALSKMLNELEQPTGTRLSERGRPDMRLTLPGEQFLTHTVRALSALNTARQTPNQHEESQAGVVRVGVLPTTALGVLPAVIGSFHKQ